MEASVDKIYLPACCNPLIILRRSLHSLLRMTISLIQLIQLISEGEIRTQRRRYIYEEDR